MLEKKIDGKLEKAEEFARKGLVHFMEYYLDPMNESCYSLQNTTMNNEQKERFSDIIVSGYANAAPQKYKLGIRYQEEGKFKLSEECFDSAERYLDIVVKHLNGNSIDIDIENLRREIFESKILLYKEIIFERFALFNKYRQEGKMKIRDDVASEIKFYLGKIRKHISKEEYFKISEEFSLN